jgi:regulator of replication initiation timing
MDNDLVKKIQELEKIIAQERQEYKDVFTRINKTSKEIIDSLVEENRQLKIELNDLKYFKRESDQMSENF